MLLFTELQNVVSAKNQLWTHQVCCENGIYMSRELVGMVSPCVDPLQGLRTIPDPNRNIHYRCRKKYDWKLFSIII